MRKYLSWRMSKLRLGSELTEQHRQKISAGSKGKKLGNKNAAKKIAQLDMHDNLIKVWDSVTEAAKGVNRAIASVSLCALGMVKHSAGFKWKYIE